ncbi:TIR domain-containing anti-phage reverse transcriptase [Erwinia persicina]|uniref:TIR domain-containing anti-phage reverse transcriptase n=1 Tax=Erwinia persicina TaxID=55211 RepID=UPI001FD35E68|nr:TIR domain-containing anti-phage reverse transcriptase [Erwinia persicina]
MSLHDKLLMHSLTFANKENPDSIPEIPQVEPEPYKDGKNVKWRNKKLKNKSTIDHESLINLCKLIESGSIVITSASDIANLLEIPVGQLLYILYHKKDNYRTFEIEKKNGKKRIINAPNGGVSILQEKVKPIIEYFYRPKKSAHGFIKERSIITNAFMHTKKKFVVNIDIENYFDSITFARVYGIFKSKPFNFAHPAATVLAQLCTHNGKLPQGACTSPILANLASTSLDKQLTQLAGRKSISYSRYADDITFSFNQKKVPDIIEQNDDGSYEISEALEGIILRNGFRVNSDKFRVQTKNTRQSVTGLVVNDKVNVDRKYIRITRSMIHRWKYDKVKYSLLFTTEKGYKTKDNKQAMDIFRNHIYGRLSFIKMVRGKDYPGYLKLMSYMSHNDPLKTKEGLRAMKETENFDVFICHASEDKEDIATPVYDELTKINISAFIDHVEIKWGDSLIEKINSALVKSKYVIAILSASSVNKEWPQKELRAVLASEISDGDVKLLTLVKKDDEEIVKTALPLLRDKLYMVYEENPEVVADRVRTLLHR